MRIYYFYLNFLILTYFKFFLKKKKKRCVDLNDTFELAYSSKSQSIGSKYYLQVDNQIRCWDAYHISWCMQVATPSLIFWGIYFFFFFFQNLSFSLFVQKKKKKKIY